MKRIGFRVILLFVLVAVAFVFACEKKEGPKGNLIVSDESFFMRQDNENA